MKNFINKYPTLSAYEADENKDYPNVSLVAGELTIVETEPTPPTPTGDWKASGLTTGNTEWVIYQTQEELEEDWTTITYGDIPNDAMTVVINNNVNALEGDDEEPVIQWPVTSLTITDTCERTGEFNIGNDTIRCRVVILDINPECLNLDGGIFASVPSGAVYVPNEYLNAYREIDVCDWTDTACNEWCSDKIQPMTNIGQPYPTCGEEDLVTCPGAECEGEEE